jgi:c-di-GMP-binding flagellar brake protein YcgR
MELRSCLRSPLKLPIKLATNNKEVNCITRDFGMGGMFIELEDGSLKAGEETQVIFSIHHDTGDRTHKLSAKIAHLSDGGLGLSFSKPDTATFRTLQELLKYTKKQNLH